jgi:Ribosomal protein L7/L12 C-terminal domain
LECFWARVRYTVARPKSQGERDESRNGLAGCHPGVGRRGGGGATARSRSVERKLDLILTNLGIDPNQGLDKQISDLVRSGQKIEAIKLYREQTGVGLKEAKDYVERL